ncbi:NAD(P)/FAD-dependent oxidoreductase [Pantoea ananatis]|uniref:NAD(P)/FAD-dependent oxidoreductase n=1 Tax=Pantoea ananas TaxID=553 RepID=UPI001B306E61|nr:FAD-dependent oxidoreductase [Pantoea ananatis]
MKVIIENVSPEIKSTDFLDYGNVCLSSSQDGDHDKLIEEAIEGNYDALLTLRRPCNSHLEYWAKRIKRKVIVCYCIGEVSENKTHIEQEIKLSSFSLRDIAEGLRKTEKALSQRNVFSFANDRAAIRNVIFVGAGITNLISAFVLQKNGYNVKIFDSAPEPNSDWIEQGCTFGGENARMFTFTEMDNYGRQSFTENIANPFSKPITQGGWDIRKNRSSVDEELWSKQYSNIPSWLASSYNDDIFSLSNEASHLWKDLLGHEVFNHDDVFVKKDILRLYSTKKKLDAAVARHSRIVNGVKLLNCKELANYNSALSPAINSGLIEGGFFVPGFTVMVHNLAKRIIKWICQNGGSISWNSRVSAVSFGHKKINLLINDMDKEFEDSHLVMSPGVYDKSLLRSTPWENKIHGVLGCWGKVKLKAGMFQHSFKLTRENHTAEDSNITVTSDRNGNSELIFGSGYGWTGLDHNNINSVEYKYLKEGVLDTIYKFTEGLSENNSTDDAALQGVRYCVRPWTASSLGIYGDVYPDSKNAFILTGGHNTGGFAQSPIIAEAILSSINGQGNILHSIYHPNRLDEFFK